MYVYPEGQTSDEPPPASMEDQRNNSGSHHLNELSGPEADSSTGKKKLKMKKEPFVAFTSPQTDADFYEGEIPRSQNTH